jgi:ADP-ribose pyrophosphatase YjhB (NUDIX family)
MDRKEKIIIDQIINGSKYFYRNISIDNVIFGYHERELKVLLQRPGGMEKWTLPGGYILKTETAEEASYKVVRYRTKLENIVLHQFKVFCRPDRNKDESFTLKKLSEMQGIELPEDHWMFDNFVSIGFFALTEYSLVRPTGDFYMEDCSWWDVNALPKLLYDHAEIVLEALKALKQFAYFHPIGYDLLPQKFTLPEIHSLYETILNKKIDIRNFTKKLINMRLIQKLAEQRNIGAHRSPYLYTFDKEKYDQLIKEGDVIVL